MVVGVFADGKTVPNLDVGFDYQAVCYLHLAGQPKIWIFFESLGQLLFLNIVSRVGFSRDDLHSAGMTKAPPPAIENFKDMGVNAQPVPDGGFPNGFPFFGLDGSFLFDELNF